MKRNDAFLISATELMDFPSGKHHVTIRCGVVAVDIEDAIKAFKLVHPNAVLWTVSHRGEIEIITSDAIDNSQSIRE